MDDHQIGRRYGRVDVLWSWDHQVGWLIRIKVRIEDANAVVWAISAVASMVIVDHSVLSSGKPACTWWDFNLVVSLSS